MRRSYQFVVYICKLAVTARDACTEGLTFNAVYSLPGWAFSSRIYLYTFDARFRLLLRLCLHLGIVLFSLFSLISCYFYSSILHITYIVSEHRATLPTVPHLLPSTVHS